MQLLLDAGADPATQNGAGETPLSLAVLLGQWECAEILVQSPRGAEILQVALCTPVSQPTLLSCIQVTLSLLA
jgi:hypothetical protein